LREPGGQHRLEPVVAQSPDGVLAGRTGAEVRAGHEHGALRVGGPVQHEVGVVRAPGVEQAVVEAGLGDPLEVDGGDDLVGVDVAAAQRDADAGVGGEGFHGGAPGRAGQATGWRSEGATGAPRSDGEDSVPRTAVAAATTGETRWVRAPLPCRPSKLRLEVEAARSPGASWSGFIPRHMEHPAWRHSAPKARNTSSRPSCSACSRTRAEPGTTSTRTSGCFVRPSRTEAKA